MADDSVIDRDEAFALLFNVSDIASSLENIERLLGRENDGEEEADEGLTRRDGSPPRANAGHTPRTCELAEKAQAKLDAQRSLGTERD